MIDKLRRLKFESNSTVDLSQSKLAFSGFLLFKVTHRLDTGSQTIKVNKQNPNFPTILAQMNQQGHQPALSSDVVYHVPKDGTDVSTLGYPMDVSPSVPHSASDVATLPDPGSRPQSQAAPPRATKVIQVEGTIVEDHDDVRVDIPKAQKVSKFIDVDPVTLSWKDIRFSVTSSSKQADGSMVSPFARPLALHAWLASLRQPSNAAPMLTSIPDWTHEGQVREADPSWALWRCEARRDAGHLRTIWVWKDYTLRLHRWQSRRQQARPQPHGGSLPERDTARFPIQAARLLRAARARFADSLHGKTHGSRFNAHQCTCTCSYCPRAISSVMLIVCPP